MRLENSSLEQLSATVIEIEEALKEMRYEPPFVSREDWRQAFPFTALPPVTFPADKDPLLQAPFLVAARLREQGLTSHTAQKVQGGWPRPLLYRDQAEQAIEVGRFVLADLQAHERGQEGDIYEELWNEEMRLLEHGERRANRLILVVVAGQNSEFDRMKLLPSILLSGDVPSPVLPIRTSKRLQESLIQSWATYTKTAFELYMKSQSVSETRQELVRNLEESRLRFQNLALKIIPKSYIDFLREIKPREIVNFSWLPLEWLEIDKIPLGYLSKVTTLRSMSLDGDCGFCADLASIYTSLIATNLQSEGPEFRTLIIAPIYPGRRQSSVNDYISSCSRSIQNWLERERTLGREIVVRVIAGNRDSVLTLLRENWSLVIYIGHAEEGKLRFPDCLGIGAQELPKKAFLGTTVVLIGCDTVGARNLAGSVASQFLSLGARGVFATSYPLPLHLAKDLFLHLLVHLFRSNQQFGDALSLLRFGTLWEHGMFFLAQDLDRTIRPDVRMVSPFEASYERYQDSWDLPYREMLDFYRPAYCSEQSSSEKSERLAERLAYRARLGGLAITFAGDLRARLFNF